MPEPVLNQRYLLMRHDVCYLDYSLPRNLPRRTCPGSSASPTSLQIEQSEQIDPGEIMVRSVDLKKEKPQQDAAGTGI